MGRARALMRRSLMGTVQWALAAWREAAAEAAEQRWAVEQVVQAEAEGRAAGVTPKKAVFALQGRADLALQMQAWAAWRDAAAAQRHLRSQVLRAYKHLYFALARRCFAALRSHAHKQRQLRSAVAIFTHSCQRRAWLTWRSHLQHRRAKAMKLRQAVDLWAGSTMAHAWHRWRGWATACREQRQGSAVAAAHYTYQLQRRALFALWVDMLHGREQRVLEYRVVGHMQGYRLAQNFRAWRVVAARQAVLRSAAQQLVGRTTVGRMQRLLMMWRWWAARQRYLRQVARAFALRRVCWYLRAWREVAHLSASLRAIGSLAASRHLARTTQQVFEAWRQHAPLQKRRRELLSTAASRLRQHSLYSAWAAWRGWAAARREHRSTVLAVLQRMQHLKLAAALTTWREAAASEGSRRDLAMRAVGHFVGNLQRRTFDTWRGNAAEGRAESAAVKQHKSLVLLKAYLGWQEVVRRHRSLRFKAQVVVRQMTHRSLGAAFRGWKARTEEGAELRRRAALLVGSLQQRTVRAAFNGWAERVQRKRAAAELVQQVLGGRLQHSLGACLAGWRAAAADSRRYRLLVQQALGRLTQRQLSQAFEHWHEVASTKRRSRQLVACALQRLGGQRLADAFDLWRQLAQQKRRLVGIQNRAVAALHCRRLCQCVAAWRAMAHKQAVARRCLAAIRLKQLRAAFSSWQAAAEDSRAAAAAAQLVPRSLQRWFAHWRAAVLLRQRKQERVEKAAAWAFGSSRQKAWKAWILYHRRHCRKLAAQQLFVAGTLRRCLDAWQEQVARRQRLAVKEQHLQEVTAGRKLAAAMMMWRRAARARRFLRRYYCARALVAWQENVAAVQTKREALRHAVNNLTNGLLSRTFTAWRSEASVMALKRAAFARKQAAVRQAVLIGDAILRQRRRELAVAAFAVWRARTCVSQCVQERFAQHVQGSMQSAFQRWAAYHRAQVQKRHQAELCQQHHAAAMQRQALNAWGAVVAEERQRRAGRAESFARTRLLLAAWRQWLGWMDLQCLRRQRLAALLSRLDGGGGARVLAAECWLRWHQAVARRRQLESRACVHAARKQAALLQEVFTVWAAYARAMRAEPDPDSPFASPRAPEADGELIWDLAQLVAGGPTTASRGSSSGGTDGSGSHMLICSSRGCVENSTGAQPPPKAAAEAAPQPGKQQETDAPAGSARVGGRWKLRGLAKNLAGAFTSAGSKRK